MTTTMNSSLAESLVIAIVSFILGVIVGQFVEFKRIRDGRGHAKLEPHVAKGWFRSNWIMVCLIVLFVISTLQLAYYTYHQRECNTEFKRVLIERARIATEDNQIRESNDRAVQDLVLGFLTLNAPPGSDAARAKSRDLLQTYARTVNANNDKQAALESARQANPYPSPRC